VTADYIQVGRNNTMAFNETLQGLRHQQRANIKRQKAHEEAGGDGWAEKYRAEGLRIAAEKALLKEQEHEAASPGAAPDEAPMAPKEFVEKELGLTGPAADKAVEVINAVVGA
jgi:hypothetical protein